MTLSLAELIGKLCRAAQMPFLYRNWWTAYANRLGIVKSGGVVTYVLRNGVNLTLDSGPADVRIINEIWLDHTYAPDSRYLVDDDWTVLDVGANKGTFSIWCSFNRPTVMVLAYEPVAHNYGILLQNIAQNRVGSQVSAHKQAVHAAGGDLEIYTSSRGGEHTTQAEIASTTDIVIVEAITLSDLLSQHNTIDLLKIDIEGSELDLILGTPSELISKVDRIVMECHDTNRTSEAETRQQIGAYLQSCGFRVGENGTSRMLYAIGSQVSTELSGPYPA